MKTTKTACILSEATLFGKTALIATGFALSSALFSSANAATMSFSSEVSTGSTAGVDYFLDDSVKAGSVDVTVNVNDTGDGIADISGVWFQIADEGLIPGLTFEEIDYTAVGTGTNPDFISSISLGANGANNNLGNGVNLNGSGPKNFDAGLRIGQSGGINGGDDFRSITFRIGHTSEDLDLSLFSEQGWATRLKSVGENRNGSSKLEATAPIFTMDPVDNSQESQNPEAEGELQAEGDKGVGDVIGTGENQGSTKKNTGNQTTKVPEPGTIAGLAFVGAMMMRKFGRQSH